VVHFGTQKKKKSHFGTTEVQSTEYVLQCPTVIVFVYNGLAQSHLQPLSEELQYAKHNIEYISDACILKRLLQNVVNSFLSVIIF